MTGQKHLSNNFNKKNTLEKWQASVFSHQLNSTISNKITLPKSGPILKKLVLEV